MSVSPHTVVHGSADNLRRLLQSTLEGEELIVVSDRAPWTHERTTSGVHLVQPASGLVSAVEPVLRAGQGSWIAHGSGTADREFVDADDTWCVAGDSRHSSRERHAEGYRLRRVWLPSEEQRRYRDGFSNAGLWPLCHMVHVRPSFSDADWAAYGRVNQRFARAVVAQASRPDPIVWIHDYHLALVPQLIRRSLPNATIVGFWHIPWGHPEQMAICPWLPELVAGLLGCDLLGFQTPADQRHFIATAAQLGQPVAFDDRHTVLRQGQRTQIRACPVSVAWPTDVQRHQIPPIAESRQAACDAWSVPTGGKLIVGVDRFDYTKGLFERLRAIECLLENHPEWIERLRFVQIAAPTRSTLRDYVSFQSQVRAAVTRINTRFASNGWQPVLLLDTCHDRPAVTAAYRAADVCLVTPLHDGMNLVCKEFVAARDDECGVLVLSDMAGAAAELSEALRVNPHHTTQVAEAIHLGLTMPLSEQRQRMRAMRATVQQHDANRWAARLLLEAATLRRPGVQPADTHRQADSMAHA